MDYATIIAAVTIAVPTAVAVVLALSRFFAEEFIKNRLQRDLEARKAELAQQVETHKLSLNQQLETYKLGLSEQLERTKTDLMSDLQREKAAVDGKVRTEVEEQLGKIAAQRLYETEARRRLYQAVGPLRFQLLLACRDLTGRIMAIGTGNEEYDTNLAGYYGRSTAYRILRPLAICELIEEQVALADFLIDPAAVECLRFRRTLTRIFSGDDLVGKHPNMDWDYQTQHVFANSLSVCANVLINRSGTTARVLRFDEFDDLMDAKGPPEVGPFDDILKTFRTSKKPIFWIRLVAYANACNALINRLGGEAFEQHMFDLVPLIERAEDNYFNKNIQETLAAIKKVELVAL